MIVCLDEDSLQALAYAPVAVAELRKKWNELLQFGEVESFPVHQLIECARAVNDPLGFFGELA